MALRVKKVEYCFPTDTTARGDGTRFDFAAITLYIPEVNSRTFLSVCVEVTALDDSAGAAPALTGFTLGCKLGSASFEDAARTPACASATIQRSWIFHRDFTSYFTTNFGSGASQTCQVGVILTGSLRRNTTAKVIIVYQFDDTSQTTRVKTVKIPLDSTFTSGLQTTTALTEMGTNQVPNLSTFLPEASVVFRQIAFEMTANEATSSTASNAWGFSLDAEGEVTDGTHINNLNVAGGRFCTFHWIRDNMVTSGVHAFKMRATGASGAGSRFRWPSVVLIVTYEYNHDTTTTVLNSLEMAVGNHPGILDGTASGNRARKLLTFDIAEPGTITLAQSGVRVRSYSVGTDNTMVVSCGSQSERTYTGYGSANAHAFDFLFRIDSGSPLGAGMTLARGSNTLTFNVRRNNATPGIMGLDAVLFLNYTSGKSTLGADAHNHTIGCLVASSSNLAAFLVSSISTTLLIAESNYRLNAASLHVSGMPQDGTNQAAIVSQIEVMGSEAEAEGWRDIGVADFGIGYTYGTMHSRTLPMQDQFYRWAGDSIDGKRLNPATARSYRLNFKPSNCLSAFVFCTYHALTFTVAGTVSGYTGDGSGITVTVHRADTGEKIASGTTTAGGTYSITVYDDVTSIFSEARQDANRLGRSENGVAA